MTVQIKNIANRMLALRLNGGNTVYLPVGSILELEAAEISANPAFEKLHLNKLLQIIDRPKPAVVQKGEKAKVAEKAADEPKAVSKKPKP